MDTRTGYARWASSYDDPNPLIDMEGPITRRILDGLPPGAALDAACGTGRYAAYLSARGCDVIGVDDCPEMLARARDSHPSVRFTLGSLQHLPLETESVDLAVCALALVHQPSLEEPMAELARVVRPGGDVVVSDVHHLLLYLGGVIEKADARGQLGVLPTHRYLPTDYLNAGLSAGLSLEACAEPLCHEGASPGPIAERWCPEAGAAAYRGVPAAVVLHLRKP